MTVDHLAPLAHLRRSPLGALADRLAAGSVPGPRGVLLREIPYLAQLNLRLDPADPAAARAGRLLGTPLPTRSGAVAETGALRVLWLGPDEWLVVGPDGAAPTIERTLRQALGDDTGSVVDVSANRTTLELSGPSARAVLEQGCSVDLHPRAFGAGRCVQTTVSKVQVVIDQLAAEPAEPTYRLLVRASFAQYLADWLLDAMTEYRQGPLG
ncbi:sarcosine oxidase subunit gamma [Streptacidiphilus jiangxiensis]|uniref:Sarcosine oxidase subunit gamma n=1 Tax=Streptacidiphilus jiangxiensis TaxID=235985 RepID=A0A1H7ZNL7_STRJI|nr:sarcosine oxidase subunit gamma family protein [Streptacidiphilus jiangxiensis]SEM59990.1 sarcosine oxidase subunit gamma [Streptacidiphilus jiangxiensis]